MTKHLQKLFALVLVCYAFLGSSSVWGQTNPAAQNLPFSTDFSSMQNTTVLPNGIAAWYADYFNSKDAAEASVPTANAPIQVATSTQTSSSAVYNYITNNNNRLYIQLTSSRANQIAAAVNTTGKFGIKVAYDIELINNQPRPVGVTLQYRVGTSGSWTTVANTDYSSVAVTTEGAIQSFEVTLPEAAEDKAVVQLRWITYEIVVAGASGARDGIALDNLQVTDGSTTVAPITTSETALNFGSLAVGTESSTLSYTLTGNSLTNSVTVSTTSPFSISKSATGDFSQSLAFSPAEIAAGAPVFVRVNTASAVGSVAGSIVHSSTGVADVNVTLAAQVYSPFVQNFNSCLGGSDLTGGWTQFSVTGTQTWACTTFGIEDENGVRTNGVQMSGFSGSSNANEDWLISPALNLSNFTFPLLSFKYRTAFTGDALQVNVSTNYSGSGNPNNATWTNILTLPADNADTWKMVENLSLENYKSPNTYVAFVYTSTNTSSARWTLDNFELRNAENYINTNNINLEFAETAVGSASDPKTFTFEAVGFTENVIVAAPQNFELSKDGATYAPALTYTPSEAATLNTVFVRMNPVTAVAMNKGPVSFTSGTEPSVTRGQLSGSSILRSATLDVVTWNLEWFGSTTQGPTNEGLQYSNARRVLSELNADIIALQEIVDENKARQLAQELGYNYESEKITAWQGANEQIVAFMYNPAVVTVKKERVLFAKLYEDIRANRVTLPNYPTGNSNLFWASGRLPYLIQFEASINGETQTYNVINIHAKANDGDDIVQYNRRKYDLQVLKDSLDLHFANMNVVLLGDFNDDVDMSVVGTGNPSTYNMFVQDNDYITLTYDLSTTGAVTYESGSFASFLDHMIISSTLEDEYIENSVSIASEFLNSISDFRSTTSDHLPVVARFFVESDVTTGIADATKGQFRVYPNPFATHIKLDLPDRVTVMRNINLVVYGVEGRKLIELSGTQDVVQRDLNASINKLGRGLYILKVEAGDELFQSRMLKQ